ncbi:Cation/hydrogen exchanger family protein [Euphorbia peplus]|nr:Cation/hydrogen exchanger family protein [Euphorbia peplus]
MLGDTEIINNNNFSAHRDHPKVCFPASKEIIQTQGVFAKENPLDFIFPILLLEIILFFTISQTVYFLLRPLRQPKFVCNMLTGIILGPSGFGRDKKFLDTLYPAKQELLVNTLSAFGAAYYAFIMAVKMDVGTLLLRSTGNINVWIISLTGYILPFIIIYLTSPVLANRIQGNLQRVPTAALSNALATTYFPIVTHVMEELDLVTTEMGRLVMACSMVSELLSHVYASVVFTFTRGSILAALESIITTTAPVAIAIHVVRPFIVRIIKITPEGKHVNEIYLTTIMVGALGMVLIGDIAWGIFLPGAILAGAIIPEGPPLGSTLIEKYELLIMEFFLPFFFMQIGYFTDIYSIKNFDGLKYIFILLLICYASKILATLMAATFLNIKFQNALLLGMIMNLKGIFELLLYIRWFGGNVLDTQNYSLLVLSTVVFSMIASPLIHLLYNPQMRLFRFYSRTQYPRTLQTTPKDVDLRVLTSIYNEENVHDIINLLEAFYPSPLSPLYTYAIHSRELIGATTPSLTPFKSNKSKSSVHYKSDQILRAFLRHSRDINALILIEPLIMIAPYKTMHNIICNFAEDKQIPFILIPFYRNNEAIVVAKNPLRGFGKKLLDNSPCTVGVLVHMKCNVGVSLVSVYTSDCKSVAVIFRGGVDDREALALGIRMLENPNVNITLFVVTSIKYRESMCEIDLEQHLDGKIVKEFVDTNMNNEAHNWEEIEVNDGIQLMEMMQSIESKYDLVLVGKKPRLEIDENIVEWMENPELGVIGDMFASSPNCKDRNLSILVLQHYKVHEEFTKSASHRSDMYSTWI